MTGRDIPAIDTPVCQNVCDFLVGEVQNGQRVSEERLVHTCARDDHFEAIH